MPSASIIKKIPCYKKNLIDMVLDIEKYPEFVPWCLKGKVHTKIDKGGTLEIIANLTIGKSFFNETYKSYIIYDKLSDSIHVTNMDGPLKHLKNKWEIREINKQSEISFEIDFEIKNVFYNMIMKKSFDQGLRNIADAFEKRAIQLFKNT